MRYNKLFGIATTAVLMLAACGGGGATSSAPPASTAPASVPASSAPAAASPSSPAASAAAASSAAASAPASSASASASAASSGSTSPSAAAAASASGKIQLGLIGILSGANAQIGTNEKQGAAIATNLINAAGGIGGKQVEIVVRDEQGKTDATVNDLRDLNSSGINLTFGYNLSSDCLAAIGAAKQINAMVATSECTTTSLTGKDYDPHFARLAASDAMANGALTTFVHSKFPTVTTWNAFGYDYVTGHDQWNGFLDALKQKGQTPTAGKAVFFPLTATDLNSFITSMVSGLPGDSAQTQGLYLATFGAGTNTLMKQGQPVDLFGKFKVNLNLNAGGFEDQAKQLGAATPDIYSEYDYYFSAFNNPLNTQFVNGYKKAYNTEPDTWAAHAFDAVYAYKAAIEKASGSTKTDDIIKAFDAGFSFSGALGDLSVRGADHQLVTPVTIRHFKGAAGNIDNTVVPASDILPPPANGK